jgi:hypothetical protein
MLRTRNERIKETRVIVEKLNEMNLTIIYAPIAKLFNKMRTYINDGEKQDIEIPIYEIDKKIIGSLEVEKEKDCIIRIVQSNSLS